MSGLKTRYRHWVLTSWMWISPWLLLLVILLSFGIGIASVLIIQQATSDNTDKIMGFYVQTEPIIARTPVDEEKFKQQVVEYENRLSIKEQALNKLNQINSQLREKYRFVLNQLAVANKLPRTNTRNTSNKSATLQHFSVVSLPEDQYQYRALIRINEPIPEAKYEIIFEFENNNPERVQLDEVLLTNINEDNNQIVPFLGTIRAYQRQLKLSTFLVSNGKKEIIRVKNKFERS